MVTLSLDLNTIAAVAPADRRRDRRGRHRAGVPRQPRAPGVVRGDAGRHRRAGLAAHVGESRPERRGRHAQAPPRCLAPAARDVQRPAEHQLGRLAQALAERRVRVDRRGDVAGRGHQLDRQRAAGHELAGVRADDVHADDAVGRGVGDDAGEALARAAACRRAPRRRAGRWRPRRRGPASRACASLSPTEPISGSVKMTTGMARASNAAGRPLSASAATAASAVALCASAGPATTSPTAAMRVGRAHVLADRDEPVGARRRRRPPPAPARRCSGDAADGDDHALGLDAVLAVGPVDDERAVRPGAARSCAGAGRRRAPRRRRSTGAVSDSSTVGRTRSSASTTVTRAPSLASAVPELEPDVAGADDGDAVGDRGQRERAGRVQHALAVERQSGQRDGPRAGGDDRVLELEEGDAVLGRAHRDAVGAVEARLAVDDAHAAGVEQPADAARQAGAQLAAPGLEALERDARRRRRSSPAARRSRVRCAASASSISALLGMQPTCRQTPPRPAGPARSTSVTSRPSWAARIAAA